MFDIVFLGTGASAPSVQRGLTSQVVLRGEHRFLIDAGEGTQRQILKSGLGFKRLDRILVTHGHLDHILGLGGLISTFVRWEMMDKILIAGGKSALDRIRELLFGVVLKGKYPPVEIIFQDLESGLIFEENDFTVTAFPVFHRTPDCFGFVFEVLSDWQLSKFKKDPKNKGKIMDKGLWKWSRHPNYFGEITMWWGIFIISLSEPYGFYSLISPLLITNLIVFYSGIPLLEKRYKNNKNYQKYAKKTPVLVPKFTRN